MPLLDAIRSRFRTKQAPEPTHPPIINDGDRNLPSVRIVGSPYTVGLPGANWSGWGYEAAAAQGYSRNSDVYSCVSLLAQACSQVVWWDGQGNSKSLTPPLELGKAIGKANLAARPSANDPIWLRKEVNPQGSIELLKKAGGSKFINDWVSYLLLGGNSFVEIEALGADPASMLWLNRPDYVLLPADLQYPDIQRGEPDRWRIRRGMYDRGGQVWRDLKNWDSPNGHPNPKTAGNVILQTKFFNPLDDVWGLSPLAAAMYQVDIVNEGFALTKRLLQRGYSPGWIEAVENSIWTDVQLGQLRERIRKSKQAGEELFLENAKWHEMGWKPDQSGITDSKILSKRDIAAIYHVPSQLIGDTQSQTYANYREARRALYMEGAIPLLVLFKDDWNRSIGTLLNSPLDFDKDTFDAIASAREEATDRVVKTWQSGLITQNEGRDELSYPRVSGGDVFYMPANYVPLGTEADDLSEPGPRGGQ